MTKAYHVTIIIVAILLGVVVGLFWGRYIYSSAAQTNLTALTHYYSPAYIQQSLSSASQTTPASSKQSKSKQKPKPKSPSKKVTQIATSSQPQNLNRTQNSTQPSKSHTQKPQSTSTSSSTSTETYLPLESSITMLGSSLWQSSTNNAQNLLGIQFYKPTYVMPAYYTGNPYQAVYQGNTPDNQSVMSAEFKAQLSLLVPLATQLMNTHTSINFAYTQLSYWQVYARSQYFRETDYEPELIVHHEFNKHLSSDIGIVHQSNGRGGDFERSWNRIYTQFDLTDGHWELRIKPWMLIFKGESSDLHNPDIKKYLGNGSLEVIYRNGRNQIALTSRNNLQSGFSRGMTKLQYSYRLWHYFYIYAQALSGYGQSLIEYDHHTNSAGIGIALNGL